MQMGGGANKRSLISKDSFVTPIMKSWPIIITVGLHFTLSQSFCDHIGNFAWVNFEGFVRTV